MLLARCLVYQEKGGPERIIQWKKPTKEKTDECKHISHTLDFFFLTLDIKLTEAVIVSVRKKEHLLNEQLTSKVSVTLSPEIRTGFTVEFWGLLKLDWRSVFEGARDPSLI